MIYEFTWPKRSLVKARIATSDCVIIEADDSLKNFIGTSYYTITEWARHKGIRVRFVSARCRLHNANQKT